MPLFQSEAWCRLSENELNYLHVNETHFHMKDCARRLALKKRYKTTPKWHIIQLEPFGYGPEFQWHSQIPQINVTLDIEAKQF